MKRKVGTGCAIESQPSLRLCAQDGQMGSEMALMSEIRQWTVGFPTKLAEIRQ